MRACYTLTGVGNRLGRPHFDLRNSGHKAEASDARLTSDVPDRAQSSSSRFKTAARFRRLSVRGLVANPGVFLNVMRMKQLEPVVWTRGTFLSPQHLQHQDRFLADLLQFRLDSLSFRPWGFRVLEISQPSLAAATFGITRAEGIFPDGLPFEFPGSDQQPDPKPLADCFARGQDTVELYLAVPRFHERGLNLASRHGDARYRVETEVFHDENTGVSERPVQVARKNLRLLAEGDPREGYVTLRAARVRRTEAGTFQLDPRFVPPLVDCHANDYLIAIARRLVEILSARSSAISGMRRQKNQSLADFTSADIATFWLLYTINTAFPVLRHLYRNAPRAPRKPVRGDARAGRRANHVFARTSTPGTFLFTITRTSETVLQPSMKRYAHSWTPWSR